MARRYVRDKIGRFAAKGGGGKRAGKLSKSTAGRGAKATYKSKTSAVRKAKRDTVIPRANYQAAKANQGRGAKGSYASRQKKIKSTFNTATRAEAAVRGKKSAVSRYTKKATAGRKAAGSGIKKGLRSQTASRRKQSFRSKATKGRTARAEYKRASSADRKARTDTGRKKVIKKQTGKPAYRDNTGFYSPQRTKAPRPGSKTKAQKIRAKIDLKKSYNKMERGSEFKGKKKGTAKQLAAGKKRSAKAKVTKTAARKASFKGKATQGRAAQAKYKKASGKLREAQKSAGKTRGKSATRVKHEKKALSAAKGGMTRVTNKMTAKGAAKAKNKKTMGKKLTKSELRMKAMIRKERIGARPKKKLTGKTAPKKGETAKQYRRRMERSGPDSVQRSLYFRKRDGSRQEKQSGYLRKPGYPGISGGESRETAKSKRRAKTRDTWGDGTGGNKRSAAITKSKERHAYKMKKRKAYLKKIKGRKG